MTDELTPAERAALCARGWMERRRKTFPNPNPDVDKLLMSQLLAIYPQPHAGADGECPDYGSSLDPCPPGCASGVCVANTGPLPDPKLPESRPASQLEREVAELVLVVAQEWLNYASLGDRNEQVRCTWHDDPEGATLHVDSETGHGGRFLISVQAQRLPDLPPIGPENDQALADFRTPDVPGWVRRTWADVRAGDTVRLPGTVHTATVDGPPVRLPWHVHSKSGKYEAISAQWSEIRVRLAGRDGVLSMDPAGKVDILLTAAEVAAVEALGGWEHRV